MSMGINRIGRSALGAGQRGSALVALVVLALATMTVSAHDKGPCETSAKAPEIASVRAAMERAPDALAPRMVLSDLLVDSACYDEAIHVLEEGAAKYPKDAELAKRLRNAKSFVSERQFFDGLNKAEDDAKLSRNVLRCTRFGDLAACDEALTMKPDDATIVAAKGDALVKVNRLNEAMAAFTQAKTLAPGNAEIAAKLDGIDTQRKKLQQRCMEEDGDGALAACQSVLTKDAADEFDISKRIAVLYQSTNQTSKALDAYIAANSLRRGDKSVAPAILALVDSTGRTDAVALAARGSSLLTLGRAQEAIASLKHAQSLAPNLPGLQDQLTAAERLVQQEQRVREQRAAAAKPAPTAAATVAAVAPAKSYSNVAEATHSN
jgi:tetratricopeptide (TPR) repeat protein